MQSMLEMMRATTTAAAVVVVMVVYGQDAGKHN